MGSVLQSASVYSRTRGGDAPLLKRCVPLPCSSSVAKRSENIVMSELGYGIAAQVTSTFLGLCLAGDEHLDQH